MIQKYPHFILLSYLFMAGCKAPMHNPLATDDDGDGLSEFQGDCDDTNPEIRDQDSNMDCDGALAVDDCDDNDPDSTFVVDDADCDGILTADDCDDNDPQSHTTATDADCDGTPTAQDCDDDDPDSFTVATDADCDGTPVEDDCNDNDPTSHTTATDADCDGVVTDDDCDDNDAASLSTSEDGDCDGTQTADDCDDNDADSTTRSNDADCDGVVTDDDCDDSDAESHTTATDGDCDGVLTADDCDDTNPSATSITDDSDCDGTPTGEDCDDDDPDRNLLDSDDDGFTTCDDDCDDGDADTHPGAAYAEDAAACMTDADGDGWGHTAPGGGITSGTDCDDDDATLNHSDEDGDGHSSCLGDCDDASAHTYVGAAELELMSLCMLDSDGDGWGDDSPPAGVTAGSDCDDGDPSLTPADADDDGDSSCSGDCDDGDDTLSSLDLDADGYSSCDGDCDDSDSSIAEPGRDDDFDGYSTCDGDCDDSDASIHPGATDIRADGIDQDCDGTEVRWSALDVAGRYGCAIDTEGAIYCWGTPSSDAGDILEPPEGNFVAISTGIHHACAIEEGTNNIECWGSCLRGECDIPSGSYKEVLAAGHVESWSGSSYYSAPYTCAILPDDSIDCWGGSISPVGDFEIPSGSFSHLTARGESPCALDMDGYIHCWGDRGEDDPHPLLSILDDISVATGQGCGLSYTGQPLCWGSWDEEDVPTEPGFLSLSVGMSYGSGYGGYPTACGVNSEQKIECWGYHTSDYSLEAAGVPMGDFLEVKVRHRGPDMSYTSGLCACGLRTDGLIDCFGSGYYIYIVSEAPVHYAP